MGFWQTRWYFCVAAITPVFLIWVVLPILRLVLGTSDCVDGVSCTARSLFKFAWGTILGLYIVFWLSLVAISAVFLMRNPHIGPQFRQQAQKTRVRWFPLKTFYINWVALISALVEFGQLNSFAFGSDVEWNGGFAEVYLARLFTFSPTNWISTDIDTYLPSWSPSFANLAYYGGVYWACLLLWTWIVILKLGNKFKRFNKINELLTLTIPGMLVGPLFMSVATTLFKTIDCTYPDTSAPTMDGKSDVTCWAGLEHRTFATVMLFGVAAYLPVAMLAAGMQQLLYPKAQLDIQYAPLLTMIVQYVKALCTASATFFSTSQYLFLLSVFFGNMLLLATSLFLKTVSVWWVQMLKVCLYFATAMTTLVAIYGQYTPNEYQYVDAEMFVRALWGICAVFMIGYILVRRIQARKSNRRPTPTDHGGDLQRKLTNGKAKKTKKRKND